jgi:nucleotide-binding universal stress UspA family protein
MGVGAVAAAELLEKAHAAGDRVEAASAERLARLGKPAEIRRFDVSSDETATIAARQARLADAFVALRPNGNSQEPERFVEGVLFGSGRHILLVPEGTLLVPEGTRPKAAFDHILIAWNGSRESARALAEAMPYLHKAKKVTVVVVDDEPPTEARALLGNEAANHLKHHGIDADVHHLKCRTGDIGSTLIAEARQRKADLVVMGGYGHSRLREWLLGGVTYELLHRAPVPLLVAH